MQLVSGHIYKDFVIIDARNAGTNMMKISALRNITSSQI
jgi:hypothetical protein